MAPKIKSNPVLTFLCMILKLLGLWKPYKSDKFYQNLYEIFGGIFLFIFVILYTTLMVANLFLLDDMQDLTNRLFMSLTEVALTIKVINFYMNNRKCQRMRMLLLTFPIESPTEEKTLKTPNNALKNLIIMYYLLSNGSVQLTNSIAALSSGFHLPYSGYYPGFDWQHSARDYWIIYVYQCVGMIITCNLNVTIDSYYCTIMQMISMETRIFGDRLRSMQYKENVTTEMKSTLINHFQTHNHIKECIRELQNGLMWSYFTQVLLSGIVICSTTNELARVNLLYLFFLSVETYYTHFIS